MMFFLSEPRNWSTKSSLDTKTWALHWPRVDWTCTGLCPSLWRWARRWQCCSVSPGITFFLSTPDLSPPLLLCLFLPQTYSRVSSAWDQVPFVVLEASRRWIRYCFLHFKHSLMWYTMHRFLERWKAELILLTASCFQMRQGFRESHTGVTGDRVTAGWSLWAA